MKFSTITLLIHLFLALACKADNNNKFSTSKDTRELSSSSSDEEILQSGQCSEFREGPDNLIEELLREYTESSIVMYLCSHEERKKLKKTEKKLEEDIAVSKGDTDHQCELASERLALADKAALDKALESKEECMKEVEKEIAILKGDAVAKDIDGEHRELIIMGVPGGYSYGGGGSGGGGDPCARRLAEDVDREHRELVIMGVSGGTSYSYSYGGGGGADPKELCQCQLPDCDRQVQQCQKDVKKIKASALDWERKYRSVRRGRALAQDIDEETHTEHRELLLFPKYGGTGITCGKKLSICRQTKDQCDINKTTAKKNKKYWKERYETPKRQKPVPRPAPTPVVRTYTYTPSPPPRRGGKRRRQRRLAYLGL